MKKQALRCSDTIRLDFSSGLVLATGIAVYQNKGSLKTILRQFNDCWCFNSQSGLLGCHQYDERFDI